LARSGFIRSLSFRLQGGSLRLWAGLLAFALGIAAFHRLPFLLPPILLAGSLVGALVLFHRRPGWVTGLIGASLAGFFWQGLAALDQQAHPFPAAREGQTVQLQGWVSGPVEAKPRRQRFRFRAERFRLPGGRWRSYGGDLRLSWYRDGPEDLAYGQRWRLAARIKRPRGFRNPGGFDYARYLRARYLSGTGYVRDEPVAARLPGMAGNPLRRTVEAQRRRIQEAVAAAAGAEGPLLRALTVGKRDQLDPETWEALRVTGTAHLVAISGLHVGWVALLVFFGAERLWRALPGAPLWLPAQRFAAVTAAAAALGYALLAGLSLPTKRALIMVTVGLGAWLLGRPFRFERALAVAALAVLVWRPDSLFEPGFWLSFTAVAGIGLLLAGPLRQRGRLAATLAIQVGVVALVSPWLAFWFGRVSLVAPFANAVAIPLFSFATVPMALGGVVAELLGLEVLAETAFAGAGWSLQGFRAGLAFLSDLPGADWVGVRPGLLGVALLLGGFAWVAAVRGPWRWPGALVAAVPLVWLGPPGIAEGEARVWVLDVGQGAATVVETARRVAVIDCGPRFSPSFSAGSALIAPFLQHRGWSAVDRLVVSHGDNDHAGGCQGLRERLPVRELTGAPGPVGAESGTLTAGEGWSWDGVRFEILAPGPEGPQSGNDGSRVVRVEAGGHSVLLPGDIEADGERHLLQSQGNLDADVVVAPHHGSASSSSPAFVAAVAPRWAVFSAGYLNQWGFPDPGVVARYRRQGARTRNTARDGAIRVELGSELGVAAYRSRADRYWHAGAPAPPISPRAIWASIL